MSKRILYGVLLFADNYKKDITFNFKPRNTFRFHNTTREKAKPAIDSPSAFIYLKCQQGFDYTISPNYLSIHRQLQEAPLTQKPGKWLNTKKGQREQQP